MGFMDSVRASAGSGGIWNGGVPNTDYDSRDMSMDEEMRRRDMNDFMKKNQFMHDLTNRQPRMQNLFNPNEQQQKPMDVVFKEDPNKITPLEQENLNVKKEGNLIDRAKIAQSGKIGEERVGLEKQKHELDVQKNSNIYETKQKDMQRKADEANSRLDLAERTLQSKQGDTDATLKFHQAQMDATKAQHALELHQKESQLEEAKRVHDAAMADKKTRTDQAGSTEQTTNVDESGKQKVVTTKKGTQSKKVGVTHPDGTHGTIDESEAKDLPEGWKLD